MGFHYNLSLSPREMQDWLSAVLADLARDHAQVVYDSGNIPVVGASALGRSQLVLVPIDPRVCNPAEADELVHDSLFAHSLVENTQIPRQNFWLRVLWSRLSVSNR